MWWGWRGLGIEGEVLGGRKNEKKWELKSF
jgi:hypothetical protein